MRLCHYFSIAMILCVAVPSADALQRKYSAPLDERAGWYSITRSGVDVTVNSAKHNLWKIYVSMNGGIYPLQRSARSGQWFLGAELTQGSSEYIRTTLKDKLLDLNANPNFVLNINGSKKQFHINTETRAVTVNGQQSEGDDDVGGTDDHDSGTPVVVEQGEQQTNTGVPSDGYGEQHENSVPLGSIGGGSSSGASSGAGVSSSGGAVTATPPAACTGDTTTWTGALTAQDMGKDASFFGAQKSRWPVVAGVYDSKGSRPGMLNGRERLRTGLAPDGTPSILNVVPQGEVQNWNFYMNNFSGGGARKVRAATSIFIPQGFTWGHDQKLALGIWGGKVGCLSGGCAIGTETGFSVRVVHSPTSGAKLYSYHLNRDQKSGVAGRSFGNVVGKSTGPLPQGVWNRLEMELTLNDPGQANGELKLFLNGNQVGQTVTGLMHRVDPSWKINGFLLNDMWGGSEEAPSRQSPRPQQYWYANYAITGCN